MRFLSSGVPKGPERRFGVSGVHNKRRYILQPFLLAEKREARRRTTYNLIRLHTFSPLIVSIRSTAVTK